MSSLQPASCQPCSSSDCPLWALWSPLQFTRSDISLNHQWADSSCQLSRKTHTHFLHCYWGWVHLRLGYPCGQRGAARGSEPAQGKQWKCETGQEWGHPTRPRWPVSPTYLLMWNIVREASATWLSLKTCFCDRVLCLYPKETEKS